MKRIVKKNQMIITVLAIMIAIAGYLNFAGSKVSKEDIARETASGAVSSEAGAAELADISDEDIYASQEDADVIFSRENLASTDDGSALEDIASLDSDVDAVETDGSAEASADSAAPGEAVLTSSVTGAGVVSNAKLMKEQTRAKNKETLLEVINNVNIADDQKQTAIDDMIAMTDVAEREMAAEMLLEAKGYPQVVVSVTGTSADVMVGGVELTDTARAQIEDIVKRKTGVSSENIVITPIVSQGAAGSTASNTAGSAADSQNVSLEK